MSPLLAALLSATAQCEEGHLLPYVDGGLDHSGWSVALGGDRAMVGSPWDSVLDFRSGNVDVYEVTDGTWDHVQRLRASDHHGEGEFGTSILIDGDRAWIGANADQWPTNHPIVYQFEWTRLGWRETERLHLTGFGGEVAASVLARSGDSLVLGDQLNGQFGSWSGAVVVFRRVAGTWVQEAVLSPPGHTTNFRLGADLAMYGEALAVGSPNLGVPGDAYLYERQGGTWVLTQTLAPWDGDASEFGTSVAMDGEVLAVGAPWSNPPGSGTGAVYVYRPDATGWSPWTRLVPADAEPGDEVGSSLALEGTRLVVGARSLDAPGRSDVGGAHVFERDGAAWREASLLLPSAGSQFGHHAHDLHVQGSRILLGHSNSQDPVHVFLVPGGFEEFCACDAGAPCGNESPEGGCLHSGGAGAGLTACGSSSISSDDLVLTASPVPSHSIGIFFRGDGRTRVPLGDGLRCVAAGPLGLFRSPPRSAGSEGVLTLGPGIAGKSAGGPPGGEVIAGRRWDFQAWFRDGSGPCGGQSNLSSAVSIRFDP